MVSALWCVKTSKVSHDFLLILSLISDLNGVGHSLDGAMSTVLPSTTQQHFPHLWLDSRLMQSHIKDNKKYLLV